MKKIFLIVLSFLLVFLFVGCSNSSDDEGKTTPDDKKETEITISYSGGAITLEVGDEKTINVTAKGAEGLEYSVDNILQPSGFNISCIVSIVIRAIISRPLNQSRRHDLRLRWKHL